jgi:hypothetical protein
MNDRRIVVRSAFPTRFHSTVSTALRIQGYACKTRNSGTGNLRWADLVKAKENDALVLLYRSDYNLSMIPKRSFSGAEAYAEFRGHLVPRFLG